MKTAFLFISLCLLLSHLTLAQEVPYQRPPQEIEELVLAETSPATSFSETNAWMIRLKRNPFYTVEELAQPELKLGGERINPRSFSMSRQRGYSSAEFVQVAGTKRFPVTGLPENSIIAGYKWYLQADNILLFVKEQNGVYLYQASVVQPHARKLSHRKVNGTQGYDISWINDTDFLFLAVPSNIGNPPVKNDVPTGPVVQENKGKKSATRTYQDLLKDRYDEELFDYYFTAQLIKMQADNETEVGNPAIYTSLTLSPDRQYLLTETLRKPYSYIVPMYLFPSEIAITDLNGNLVKVLQQTPLYIPEIGYDTTSPYPRWHAWRSDKPATVYWVEAQDEGNPKKKKVEYSDIVYQLSAPFSGENQTVARTRLRFGGISWGNDDLALITEMTAATRRRKTYTFKPGKSDDPVLLFDLSLNDQYNNPGQPYTKKNAYGRRVLYTRNNNTELLMLAQGASPEGDMPYISLYNIPKKQNKILWRCAAPYYEQVVRVIDPDKLTFITSRQSTDQPVNFFIRDIKKKKVSPITSYPNPYPSMEGVSKELIRYTRADGIQLTATVYLPKDYDKDKDGSLPVLMWAYPREYKSAADAAQVRGSKYTFTTIGYGSPVFWVTRGYCVMNNVEMPIVGDKDTEPNDTFVEQVIMNAEAAVKAIADKGVGDPNRVAVGGHSYGAFMTANLLSHTKLFKAGIARSGAYNRTLTPFGFQAERRTYWQAPDIYNTMSPFMYADKLHGAILLIHGEADNNSGTFPLQSERYYNALKGHGATVRYVELPLESHGYSAKENILHMLYETDAWLEKYVKNANQ